MLLYTSRTHFYIQYYIQFKGPDCWSGNGLNSRLPAQPSGPLPNELTRRQAVWCRSASKGNVSDPICIACKKCGGRSRTNMEFSYYVPYCPLFGTTFSGPVPNYSNNCTVTCKITTIFLTRGQIH